MKKWASTRREARSSKSQPQQSKHTEECDSSPLTSPVSITTTEVFQKKGGSSLPRRGSYDEGLISPFAEDGDLRSKGHGSSTLSMFDDSGFLDEVDITEEPSEGDYEDFGHDSCFNEEDFQQHSMSSSKKRANKAEAKLAIISSNVVQRSTSVQRPMQESSIAIIERADETLQRSRRRATSTGRGARREQMTATTLKSYNSKSINTENNSETSSPKKRKSKMEKILQLQEKNQRYKDEFRKVQKDRKTLKKELESKKLEAAALTKEIDTHMAETSMLKLKLSEALQQLDRTDYDERKDKSAISKLQKELSAVRGDYNAAVSRIARMREEVEAMKVSVARKDEQIKSLTSEVTQQSVLVDNLHMDTVALKKHRMDFEKTQALQGENQRLQKELGETLQNASTMVKEREDAISELLKENEELKRLVEVHQEQHQDGSEDLHHNEDVSQEELAHLRAELDTAAAALEESQDRTVLLEEEVEAWIARGQEMESEIASLRDDVEAWQTKAESAEETIAVVEASARESVKKVALSEAALTEAERRYQEQLKEQERRHSEAMWDLKERTEKRVAEAEKSSNPKANPQDEALRLAMAKKEAEKASSGGSWGLIKQLRGSSDGDEEMTEEQRQIKDLMRTNAEQAKELEKKRSEFVQLSSTHRETKYTNEKRIELLEKENKAHVAKQKAMEKEIAALRQALSNASPDLVSESSASTRSNGKAEF